MVNLTRLLASAGGRLGTTNTRRTPPQEATLQHGRGFNAARWDRECAAGSWGVSIGARTDFETTSSAGRSAAARLLLSSRLAWISKRPYAVIPALLAADMNQGRLLSENIGCKGATDIRRRCSAFTDADRASGHQAYKPDVRQRGPESSSRVSCARVHARVRARRSLNLNTAARTGAHVAQAGAILPPCIIRCVAQCVAQRSWHKHSHTCPPPRRRASSGWDSPGEAAAPWAAAIISGLRRVLRQTAGCSRSRAVRPPWVPPYCEQSRAIGREGGREVDWLADLPDGDDLVLRRVSRASAPADLSYRPSRTHARTHTDNIHTHMQLARLH